MMTPKSDLERELESHIRLAGLPDPVSEYRFAHPERQWRADFAWPDQRILVEVEGGTWVHGSHVRGKRFESDCEKYNWAAMHGWTILRFTTDMIDDGRAIATIKEAMK